MKAAGLSEEKGRPSALPCTFVIKVIHADRNTIQGYIQWIEKEKTVAFRSYMELLHLTQEALKNNKNGLVNLRSWDS